SPLRLGETRRRRDQAARLLVIMPYPGAFGGALTAHPAHIDPITRQSRAQMPEQRIGAADMRLNEIGELQRRPAQARPQSPFHSWICGPTKCRANAIGSDGKGKTGHAA